MRACRAWAFRITFALSLAFSSFSFVLPSLAQEPDGISPGAKAYLEQVLDLMQKNALHKKSIDWALLRKETQAHAKGAQTTFDTYPAIAFALTQLQEHHSWLQLPDSLSGDKRQAISSEIAKFTGKTPTYSKPSPFFPQKEMQGHTDQYKDSVIAHVFVPMCVGPYSDWQKNGPYFQEFAEKLPDGASLFLCDGVEADRTGKLYHNGLEPDTKVPAADARPAEEKDAALLAAKQWLAQRTARGGSDYAEGENRSKQPRP